MAQPMVEIHGLCKKYKIVPREPYLTLRDQMIRALKAPFGIFSGKAGRRSSREEFSALHNVSFDVSQGEAVGIIGRNGAGKTTLLKILSRITYPTKGRVGLYGRVASLLEIGTGFHPELSGRENIYFNGSVMGMKRAEINRKFNDIVEFSEIGKFLDTPVKRYSSGMQVRLAFSVAAFLEPEVLLIDEVLAVGDAVFQKRCLGKMQNIAGQGRTVLFVSHNMAAVQRLCAKAVLLEKGAVARIGPASQVVNEYLASKLKQSGEKRWANIKEAPGDDAVRLRCIRAIGATGHTGHEFKTTDSFSLEAEFLVASEGYRLSAVFSFYNDSGSLVFAVGDFQDGRWQTDLRPPGIHRSRVTIPENFLNEGTYTIAVSIVTNPDIMHLKEEDALAIVIVDTYEEGGARGNYTHSWPPAAIRPLFKWSFEYEGRC